MSCRSKLAQRTPAVTACVPLCGALGQEAGQTPVKGKTSEFEAVSGEERRTIGEAG